MSTARALLPVLLLALPLTASAEWSGRFIEDETGHTIVENPKSPIEPPVTVELEELWRIGGESDDESEFFGVVSEIVSDPSGNVYLLDSQLAEVKVFDADGRHVRTIGREGEGPGEFRGPFGMFFLPNGNLGVMQTAPGRIAQLTPEGEPKSDHPLPTVEGGGFLVLRRGESRDGNLVVGLQTNAFGDGQVTQVLGLVSLGEDGQEVSRYVEKNTVFSFANAVIDENKMDTFERRWTIGPDGRVYAAIDNLAYEIHVYSPEGPLDRVVSRAHEPFPRDDEEKALVRQIYGRFTAQIPNAKIQISETAPVVRQLLVRDDGSLWVLTGRGSRENPAGTLGTFDVFDPEGRFQRQITLVGQGDPMQDGYFFVGDRVLVVTGYLDAMMSAFAAGDASEEGDDDAEPMSIIAYRLDGDTVAMRH